MADMETERANRIWVGNTKSTKDSLISQAFKDCENLYDDDSQTTDYRANLNEVLIYREPVRPAGQRTKCR